MSLRILPAMLTAVVAAGIAFSCSSPDAEARDMTPAISAKQYYDSLCNGGSAYFVENTAMPQRVPDGYRRMLVENAKMYIAGLGKSHGGLDSVSVQDCAIDSLGNAAEAYLMLHFSDKTSEEVVVPMVRRGDRWLMR